MRQLRAQAPEQHGATEARQAQLEHDDIGLQVAGELEGRDAVAGLGHHRDAGIAGQRANRPRMGPPRRARTPNPW